MWYELTDDLSWLSKQQTKLLSTAFEPAHLSRLSNCTCFYNSKRWHHFRTLAITLQHSFLSTNIYGAPLLCPAHLGSTSSVQNILSLGRASPLLFGRTSRKTERNIVSSSETSSWPEVQRFRVRAFVLYIAESPKEPAWVLPLRFWCPWFGTVVVAALPVIPIVQPGLHSRWPIVSYSIQASS